MKLFLQFLVIMVITLLIPAALVYFGGAYVKLSWGWLRIVDEETRAIVAGVLLMTWLIILWLGTKWAKEPEDDRRDG